MSLMTPEWQNAYKSRYFTEFQEQRAPGHTVLGYKMFRTGFLDLKDEIRDSLAKYSTFIMIRMPVRSQRN
jgi:formate C-acetyltransferase